MWILKAACGFCLHQPVAICYNGFQWKTKIDRDSSENHKILKLRRNTPAFPMCEMLTSFWHTLQYALKSSLPRTKHGHVTLYSLLNFCFGLTCCVFAFFLGGVTESFFSMMRSDVYCLLCCQYCEWSLSFCSKSQLIWINGSINTKTPRPWPSFLPWLTRLVLQSMKITNSSRSEIDLNFICMVSCSVY